MNSELTIPAFLHEVHGKKASVMDLVLTYFTAFALAVVSYLLMDNLELKSWETGILLLLAMDIGGGVVANFSRGTSTYYAESPKARRTFVAMHLSQPALLAWVFPGSLVTIMSICAYTLITTSFVNMIRLQEKQRVFASFFLSLGLMLFFLLPTVQPIIYLILILYMVKLVMAFAVQWK
ncbi:hypothetical protein AAG747_22925 [Rapidithrix thailandica]|uniref:Uncharacterized protein n=1 Tax=Rapidithrix thailandica TaxID=413964 RepID=A0AAW9SA58_9BACT